MRHKYNTNGKTALIDYMKEHADRHFTVEEIISGISSEGNKASRSSVYRQVAMLLEAGEIRRFETHGKSSFVYQYANKSHDCSLHYHLKCTECGKLIHMECEKMNDLKMHILREHGFTIGGAAVINGICLECSKKAEDIRFEKAT